MEYATIFFTSVSSIAVRAAISIVSVLIIRRRGLNQLTWCRVGESRISKYTPAVTKVDE